MKQCLERSMKFLKIIGESVDDMKFVIKMFLGAILLIYLMQLKIDGRTIESRAYQLLAKSKVTSFLNTIALGLVEIGTELKDYVQSEVQKQEKNLKQ